MGNKAKLDVIAANLGKQIAICEKAYNQAIQTMAQLCNTDDYDDAWYSHAAISTTLHHLNMLMATINTGNVEAVKHLLSFTIYHIEQSTNPNILSGTKTADHVLNAKALVYEIFKPYRDALAA